MNVSGELWDRLEKACADYVESSRTVNELADEEPKDEDAISRAMGLHILNMHALRDALELTPGVWGENDVDLALSAVKGEVNLIHYYREIAREEQKLEMLNNAIVHDQDGNELELPAGKHQMIVTEAWDDADGQLHVKVKKVGEGE